MTERIGRVDLSRSALLVIDVQNDFCHPDGGLGKRGISTDAAQAMAKHTAVLIDMARAAMLTVIYAKTIHAAWTDSASWIRRHQDRGLELCRAGSWGAEFYGLSPLPDEPVIVKHRYDAFHGTDLELILRARGIEGLLLAGVATNICVETTAREAFVRDYSLTLVEDCLAGSSDAEHHASLQTLKKYFDAFVMSAQQIGAILRSKVSIRREIKSVS